MIYLPPPAMTGQQKRRGFNLIEAAIVLGVVGLVIGGIWAAASAVNQKLAISRDYQLILSAVAKARELSAGQSGNITWNGTTAVASGIFPENLLKGSTVYSNTGASVIIQYLGGLPPSLIDVALYEFPTKTACIELGPRLSTVPNIVGMTIANEAWGETFFDIEASGPVTPKQIASLLSSSSICNELRVAFR